MPNLSKKKRRKGINLPVEGKKAEKFLRERKEDAYLKKQKNWKYGHLRPSQVISGSDKMMEKKARAVENISNEQDQSDDILTQFESEQKAEYLKHANDEIDPSDSEIGIDDIDDNDEIFQLRRNKNKQEDIDEDDIESSGDNLEVDDDYLPTYHTEDNTVDVDEYLNNLDRKKNNKDEEDIDKIDTDYEDSEDEEYDDNENENNDENEQNFDDDEDDDNDNNDEDEEEEEQPQIKNNLGGGLDLETLEKEIDKTYEAKGKKIARILNISKQHNDKIKKKNKDNEDDSDDNSDRLSIGSVLSDIERHKSSENPDVVDSGIGHIEWGRTSDTYYGADTEAMQLTSKKQTEKNAEMRDEENIGIQMQNDKMTYSKAKDFFTLEMEFIIGREKDKRHRMIQAEKKRMKYENEKKMKYENEKKMKYEKEKRVKYEQDKKDEAIKLAQEQPSKNLNKDNIKNKGLDYIEHENTKDTEHETIDNNANANNTDHNANKTDHETDHNANKTDHDANKTDHDANKTDHDANKTDHDANKTDHNANKTDHDANKTDHNAYKADDNANKTDHNDGNANKTDDNANKTDDNDNGNADDNANDNGNDYDDDDYDDYDDNDDNDDDNGNAIIRLEKNLDERKKLQQILDENPELPGIIEELGKTIIELEEVDKQRNKAIDKQFDDAIKNCTLYFDLLRSYSTCLSFYLQLKSCGELTKEHPIFGKILELRKHIDNMKELYNLTINVLNQLPNEWNRLKYIEIKKQNKALKKKLIEKEKADNITKEENLKAKKEKETIKKEKLYEKKKKLQEILMSKEEEKLKKWDLLPLEYTENDRRPITKKIFQSKELKRYRSKDIPRLKMKKKYAKKIKLWRKLGYKKYNGSIPQGRGEWYINMNRTTSVRYKK